MAVHYTTFRPPQSIDEIAIAGQGQQIWYNIVTMHIASLTLKWFAAIAISLAFAGCANSIYTVDAPNVKSDGGAKYVIQSLRVDDDFNKSVGRGGETFMLVEIVEAAKKNCIEHNLGHVSEIDEDGTVPLFVEVSTHHESDSVNFLFLLSLGLVPCTETETTTYYVSVTGPDGTKKSGLFRIVQDSLLGWLALIVPYPSLRADKRTWSNSYAPGNLVYDGLSRTVLELARSMDCDPYKALSLTYDPKTRKGVMSVRIEANKYEEARAYIRKNIATLARDANVALKTDTLPPESHFYLGREEIKNGNILEIEFETE